MDLFVEFILEKYQRIHPTIQIVGSPILPNELEIDHPYLMLYIYINRGNGAPIQEQMIPPEAPLFSQIFDKPENRVQKVIFKSLNYTNRDDWKYYSFLNETTGKVVIRPEQCYTQRNGFQIQYVIYKYEEDYACK